MSNGMKKRVIVVLTAIETGVVFGIWQQSLFAGLFIYLFLLTLMIIKTIE